MKVKVKICCIGSEQEAKLAIQAGANALGLVAKMPSGPGPISDQLILQIAQSVPASIATFMLTSETTAADIIEHHKRTRTNTIQIVDALSAGTYQEIKRELPDVKIVQVIHVIDESSIDEAIRISAMVDAILLDSGNPNAAIKELGGTGRIHNWSLSKKIVEQLKVPVYLAGGLTAENVQQAIEMVNPFGVDLCSSVRTNGTLDPVKLERFFVAVNS
jgi:phosphoribosylanthranilate isomerase